jgi:Tlde1 domain
MEAAVEVRKAERKNSRLREINVWTYSQSTGELYHDGVWKGLGYSGAPGAINDPAKQGLHNVGPIPCGFYTIGAPVDSLETGPFSLPLTPDATNEMFGRSAFFCHGDAASRPGTASEGCLVAPRVTRQAVWASGDRRLQVVPFFEPSGQASSIGNGP